MNCSTVLVFLCMLIAQAACGPIRNASKTRRALNATIKLMQEEIRTAVDNLAEPGQLPNSSCLSLNISQLEQKTLTVQQLSSFRCLMLETSLRTPELSPQLQIISQYTVNVEHLTGGRVSSQDCSLTPSEQDMDSYVYAKCLLQFLDQWLSKAKFEFTA